MFSPANKRNISRIVPFGLIWLTFSLVYSLLERGLLGTLNYYPSTGNPYHFQESIIITAITAIVLGLFVGTIETVYFNKLFLKMSFIKKIIYKTAIYVVIIIVFLLTLALVFNAVELKDGIFSRQVLTNTWKFFLNYAFWSIEVYIAAIIGVSLFYTEVSENLGQGVLNNFFAGKYHRPVVEERIFMFVDMKSSTTIAENIGHVKYFEMLKEYFSDLTAPIIQYSGEIYQYVGDEIVVSWTLKRGLKNNNCVECFFGMKRALKKHQEKYMYKFSLLPEFKAGLHFGQVTTGEIGVIKREIIFTGDVLNTTARIQSLCNSFNVDILISEHLVKKLDAYSKFEVKALGESQLRGRDEKVVLFTINSL